MRAPSGTRSHQIGRSRSGRQTVVASPHQSPAPGFCEKNWNLSGFPSQSLELRGGGFFIVMFGQTFVYSAFSRNHFSSPGSVSGLIASTGIPARKPRNQCTRPDG